jgi:hypothetical protein
LLRYAMEIGWRESDPTARVRAFKSIEIHTWTESEISQFELRWPIGTKQRLAFDLLNASLLLHNTRKVARCQCTE